jgi:NAD-dependent protein deacetylases, SIR2 family
MRLDLSFWGKQEANIYGIAITIDYKHKKYGWKAEIFDSKKCIAQRGYGDLFVDQLNPPKGIQPVQIINTGHPKTLSVDIFIDRLLPYMYNGIIYTGAGMAASAGVWNLSQLREKFFMDDFNDFIFSINNNPATILAAVKEFARQLYETTPTKSYSIISDLQKKFNLTVVTENRDMLHQKADHNVITRDLIKRFPMQILGKPLVVTGLSDDHSGFIHLYHSMNKDKPIFIINNGEIPPYCFDRDYYLSADLNDFFIKLKERIL